MNLQNKNSRSGIAYDTPTDGEGYIVNEEGKSRYAGWNRYGQVGFEKDEKTEVDENGLYRGYFLNGQLRYEWYFKLPLDGTRADGISRSWWPDGKLKQEETWKDGEKDGLHTVWYDNGQKESEVNYKNCNGIARKDGKWIRWYENGQKKSEEFYRDGKQDGLHTLWYDNGQKEFKGRKCHLDRKDGLWTYWYDNGQKKEEETYKDGNKLSSVYWEYHKNGQKKFEWNYKDGKRISDKHWNEDGSVKE